MKITIDQVGRVVIPKKIRERYHMRAGTELILENEPDGISLKVSNKEPSLIRKAGILVHHGPDAISLDTADFLNREREIRDLEITHGSVAENPKE
jgi:AbrB family looped-hinge helix DNA binding protein